MHLLKRRRRIGRTALGLPPWSDHKLGASEPTHGELLQGYARRIRHQLLLATDDRCGIRAEALSRGTTERPKEVAAPAAHTVSHHQCARVMLTGRNSFHARQYVIVGWHETVSQCAVAQLPILIATPATHTAALGQRAGVTATRGYRLHVLQHITGWGRGLSS